MHFALARQRTIAGRSIVGVNVLQPVLHEVRSLHSRQNQFSLLARQLLLHCSQQWISHYRYLRCCNNTRSKGGHAQPIKYSHYRPPFIAAESTGGGQTIGGRDVPCACRCVSIALTSIAGATALTGTVPLSAPHSPLKMSWWSLVTRMLFSAACGVPTMLTPRTNSSGRPSTYTR